MPMSCGSQTAISDKIDATPKADAVQLAAELIEEHSGKFEPQKMPNEYAEATRRGSGRTFSSHGWDSELKRRIRASDFYRAAQGIEVIGYPLTPSIVLNWRLRRERGMDAKGIH